MARRLRSGGGPVAGRHRLGPRGSPLRVAQCPESCVHPDRRSLRPHRCRVGPAPGYCYCRTPTSRSRGTRPRPSLQRGPEPRTASSSGDGARIHDARGPEPVQSRPQQRSPPRRRTRPGRVEPTDRVAEFYVYLDSKPHWDRGFASRIHGLGDGFRSRGRRSRGVSDQFTLESISSDPIPIPVSCYNR